MKIKGFVPKIKTILIVLVFCITNQISAQKQIISLHPYIGDTISVKEKQEFYLFDRIRNDSLNWCMLYEVNDQLFLTCDYTTGKSVVKTDSAEITMNQSFVIKLLDYKINCCQLDTNLTHSKLKLVDESFKKANTDLLNDGKRVEIVKDGKRHYWLKSRAIDQGLFGKEKDDYIKSTGTIAGARLRVKLN